MNKEEKFYSFLESLKTEKNETLIESVKEAYAITQKFALNEATIRGMPMPDIKSPERMRLPSKTKPATPEEIASNNARFKRESSQAGQGRGRASGAMKQVEKYAMTAPAEVEAWINTVLKPAIKAGKQDTDSRYGTNSAKVGFGQRLKNVGKAMLGEGQEVAYDDQDDEDENEEELGGFQSNKQQKREAAQRRGVLKEGQEVDYTDDDPFAGLDDDEEEEEVGGFESNKLQRREAQMKRGSVKQG
jgi:hypothetical protein